MANKEVRVAFTDFPGRTNIEYLTRILSDRFDVIVDENNPDYVIYSVFGSDFLKFPDAVRICFSTENVRADFNLCDYAFTCDWLAFGDRHFRAPNFILYPQWEALLEKRSSKLKNLDDKHDFCNFIYTNGLGHPIRTEFFHALNKQIPVDSFGTFLKNCDRKIGAPYRGDWSSPKVEAQRSFKFSIAFENSTSPGYTTEKIVHALAADTIPIYWGDPLVGRVFNEDRMINIQALGFEKGLERITHLNSDDDAYLEVVNKPFFSDETALDALQPTALIEAFTRIFEQPKLDAFRREFYLWGPRYENRRKDEVWAGKKVARLKKLMRLKTLKFW